MARVSIIGPTSIVIGDVTGRGDLEIIGRVQGDVVLEGTVTVAPDGVVLGSIRAQGVRVAGRVDGSVVAKESLSLQAGANVSGDLVAARLGIEEGARVRGTVRTEGGDLEEDDDEDEVIADQSDDVASPDGDFNVIDGAYLAKCFRQPAGLYCVHTSMLTRARAPQKCRIVNLGHDTRHGSKNSQVTLMFNR